MNSLRSDAVSRSMNLLRVTKTHAYDGDSEEYVYNPEQLSVYQAIFGRECCTSVELRYHWVRINYLDQPNIGVLTIQAQAKSLFFPMQASFYEDEFCTGIAVRVIRGWQDPSFY